MFPYSVYQKEQSHAPIIDACQSIIQASLRLVAGEPALDIRDEIGDAFCVEFRAVGIAGGVRCEDGVVELAQRTVGREWFFGEHIETGAADRSALQGTNERCFVDESAAGGVDEQGAGLHLRERGVVDEMAGVGFERNVQRNDVAFREKLRKRYGLTARNLNGPIAPAENAQTKRLRAHGDGATNVSKSDEPEGAPAKLAAMIIRQRGAAAGVHKLVERADVFVVTEQKRHHMLGDGVGIESGGVTNLHAAPTAGGKIDVVIAGADLDKTQPRRLREKSVVDKNMLRDHRFCVGEMRRAGIRRSDGELPLCGKDDAHPRLGGDGIITDDEKVHDWLTSPAGGRRRGSVRR